MKELRVGIVGVGGIANGKHMPALAKIPEVEMVAFCDLIKERAEKGAKQYGTSDALVCTDYRELVARDDIDIVHVCTTNDAHSFVAIAALESGKHVMCEKPMAKSAAEGRQMVEAAKKTGKKLTIGYQNRYRADAFHLKALCDQGVFGDIYFAKALAIRRRAVPTWGSFLDEERQGGGPLIDIGTHALDLALFMMNNYEPVMAVGTAYHKLSKRKNAANAWGPWDPDKFTVEDSAFGFVTFKNGATVILESSWALNTLQIGEAKVVLCGTEAGADMLDGLRINGEENSRLYTKTVETSIGGVAYYEGVSQNPGDIETRMWIDAVKNDTEVYVKPEQALVVTEILEGIYKSAETGKPYYF